MRLYNREKIEAVLSPDTLVSAVKDAFIAFSNGHVTTPPVGYLPFKNPPGDMHIKYGHTKGDSIFVIKVATGFYNNPKIGLPSSNGLILVMSAETGAPLALMQDEGYLTDARTAAAGALASHALAPKGPISVGIVGTGIQARMQLHYLQHMMPLDQIFVWGRSEAARGQYVQDMENMGIKVQALETAKELCEHVNLIITTTPSTEPIIDATWVKGGTHITAVGADAPGKQELDSALFERAAFTVFDSKEQCLHHGEASHYKKAFTDQNSAEIGYILENLARFQRQTGDITIADLTGIAAQDIAAAKTVWSLLKD